MQQASTTKKNNKILGECKPKSCCVLCDGLVSFYLLLPSVSFLPCPSPLSSSCCCPHKRDHYTHINGGSPLIFGWGNALCMYVKNWAVFLAVLLFSSICFLLAFAAFDSLTHIPLKILLSFPLLFSFLSYINPRPSFLPAYFQILYAFCPCAVTLISTLFK